MVTTRSPRLDTVLMVEKFIQKKSGNFKKTELFQSLPKKMLWTTFYVIFEYLCSINKIAVDKRGYIIYIWNPDLASRFKHRKGY